MTVLDVMDFFNIPLGTYRYFSTTHFLSYHPPASLLNAKKPLLKSLFYISAIEVGDRFRFLVDHLVSRPTMNEPMNLFQVIDQHDSSYFDYLTKIKHYSPETVKAYRKDLLMLKSYIASQKSSIDPLKTDSINPLLKKFLKFLYEKRYHPNSIYRIRCSLENFFKYLMKQQIIDHSPFKGIYSIKRKQTTPIFLNQKKVDQISSQLNQLRSNSQEESYLISRDRLVWELLYGLGLRISEVSRLDLTSIDLNHSNVTVLGKGNTMHLLPLTPKLKQIIVDYLLTREIFLQLKKTNSSALFLNHLGHPLSIRGIRYSFMKRLEKNQIFDPIHPHALRHSIATHLLENGADIKRVKQLLRHKSIDTTQIYTHLSKKFLKEKYHLFHPMGNSSRSDQHSD